ncbi:hypothetical protein [Sphaerospermopsis torques-reginae]|uniref:Transposase n=1 Tax=Sphaerospermopsis torques-reginae ITEP-024 TaxID=984208 RepID=A0ABX8WTX9_9CYAN|nr:hypothetical protein [Sphaerospermopsis torques-reginae]QYX29865.1 hypothetical protein K2F26_12800 [Sphaerospermopsis torques-reginae ITEP-024]
MGSGGSAIAVWGVEEVRSLLGKLEELRSLFGKLRGCDRFWEVEGMRSLLGELKGCDIWGCVRSLNNNKYN